MFKHLPIIPSRTSQIFSLFILISSPAIIPFDFNATVHNIVIIIRTDQYVSEVLLHVHLTYLLIN